MAEFDPVGYQGTVECDSCEGTDNVYHYCIQCPGNICDTCKLTHCNTRLTRKHRILPRTHPEVQQSRLSTKVYCEQHRDKEYVNFCTQCKVPCCPTCITKEHSGHTFSDLGDEISKVEKEMNEIASNLEIHTIPQAEKKLRAIATAISDYKISADKVKQSAHARIQRLHKYVDSSGRQFMDALDTQMNKDLRHMEDKMKEVNDGLAEMKSTADFCRTTPADATLLLKIEKVKSMLEMNSPQISIPSCLTFTESNACITADTIGQFKLGLQLHITENSVGNLNRFFSKCKEIMNEAKPVKTISQSGGRIVHASDGKTWISDNYTKDISVFDEQFKLIDTIKIRLHLADMVLAADDAENTTFIATINGKNSKVLNISRSSSYGMPLKLTGQLVGICINNKREIVIGVTSPHRLVVYSSDATQMLQRIEEDDNGKRLFWSTIYRVRQTITGEYLVASGSEVICFSIEWKVTWRCEFPSEVRALCCDRFNNIMVVPREATDLTIIGIKDGKILQCVDLENVEISRPLSLSVDRKGLLWIGQEHKVTVLSYLKE